MLELTNAVFRHVYVASYLGLVSRAPHVLGYLHDIMDKPRGSGRNRRDLLRIAVEKANFSRFQDLLREQRPDLAINTHFLPAELIASLRREGKCDFPHVTVTTDFDTHRLWGNEPCERYFTATEDGALGLSGWGVPGEKIAVTGIPIHPVFAVEKPRGQLLQRHGVSDDRPVVLQVAGGLGLGPIERIYRALLDVQRPMHVIVVTGRNAAARRSSSAWPCPRATAPRSSATPTRWTNCWHWRTWWSPSPAA